VIGFLRFVGVLNASVWLGAVIFFTLGAAPALFSNEMLSFLPRAYAGAAALVVVKRYLILQQVCAMIALAHMFGEWLYTGKPLHRLSLGMLCGLLGLALVSGFWLQPKMRYLHVIMYAPGPSQEQKEQAGKTFRLLHGAAQVPNVLILCGLLVYLWQITNPANAPRFYSLNKFRE
jgi:hypothetical protein